MSEQNNNTIEYKECNVCYEDRDCECFDEGVNCEHSVCVYCSERITKCPFCRKRWTEYEDSDEEEEEEEEEEPEYTYRVEVRVVVDNDEDQDSVWVENEHGRIEFLNREEAIDKYRELVIELSENSVYCRMPVRAVAVRRSTDDFREDEEDIEVTDFEDPHEQCGRCGNPATSGLINDEFICIECRENEE